MSIEALQAEKVPFEEGIAALEQIVRGLEQKEVPLEEALTMFRRGIELVQHCSGLLDQAEQEMEVLLTNPKGEVIIRRADFPLEG